MPQMTATCLATCESPAYLAALESHGFTRQHTIEREGKTYTHDDIASIVDESYRRLRPQYVTQVGAKKHVQRKNRRQFERAVKADVGSTFHFSWWTIVLGLIVFLLTGPLGLLVAICICLFEIYFTKDVDGDSSFCMAMESGN